MLLVGTLQVIKSAQLLRWIFQRAVDEIFKKQMWLY